MIAPLLLIDNLMRNNRIKKKAVIIILEGVWGSGKTTLAKELQKKYGAILIKEPHHIRAGIKTKNKNLITEWYLRAHEQNIRKGINLALQGHNVVVERSVLSSIAFAKLFLKKNIRLPLFHFEKFLRNIQDSNTKLYFAYLYRPDIKTNLDHMRHNPHLKGLADANSIKRLDSYMLDRLCIMKRKKLINLIILPTAEDFSGILN